MPSAATIRTQVEAALAARVPSALSMAPRTLQPVASTGIAAVDAVLGGGLPVGAITEIVGPECSGRTSLTLSFLARLTQTGKVCAWIDGTNALQPESAAAAGVDLARMLWVRCGVPGGGRKKAAGPWGRVEQGLKVADLLLQGGGFSGIVLDLAGVAPEVSSRVPLATWFRYRAAAERSQSCVLLLTQYACAKSSAGLVLNLQPGVGMGERTVFTGVEHRVEVARQRFSQTTNVIPMRKPPVRESGAGWRSRAQWAGR